MPETEDQKQIRLALEHSVGRLAREAIAPCCPPGVGFALLFFDFGHGGNMAYVSNGVREDMIKALEDLLVRLRKDS